MFPLYTFFFGDGSPRCISCLFTGYGDAGCMGMVFLGRQGDSGYNVRLFSLEHDTWRWYAHSGNQ